MKRRTLVLLMITSLILTGCGASGEETADNSGKQETEETTENKKTDASEMFSDRDFETDYDESESAVIELKGDSAACESDAVQIDGSTVTITDEGTYILRGTLENGMIVINAKDSDKPQLVLDNVSVHSETSAPLYILEADKVFVTMAEGSENTFSNGGSFEAIDENNIDATIFSKQDLTFNGNGTLTVSSPADQGIVCKDDLVFTSGTYQISAASQGLDANDSIRIAEASATIAAGKDGIHAENSEDESLGFVYIAGGTFDITAEGDGISASGTMELVDGTYQMVTGGGSVNGANQTSDSWGGFPGNMGGPGMGGGRGGDPMSGTRPGADPMSSTGDTSDASSGDSSSEESTSIKGLKAAKEMIIRGGVFTIDSADDAIHSNTSIEVLDGTFEMATGDDGIHADETLKIAGGTITVTESYEGLEALDIEITGGKMDLVTTDDGLNAAGGTDQSGYGGQRGNEQFGGGQPGMGGSASNGSILISGGEIYMNASGDGIDANGSLEITGGYTVVCGPTVGDTATLDYDTSAVITGGTFIGTGSAMMAQTFSDSEQGIIAVSVGTQAEGTEITLTDAEGNVIISHAPELSYGVVILSSPDIVKGEMYTITVGSASGEFEAS